jgi:hypothetical protein
MPHEPRPWFFDVSSDGSFQVWVPEQVNDNELANFQVPWHGSGVYLEIVSRLPWQLKVPELKVPESRLDAKR